VAVRIYALLARKARRAVVFHRGLRGMKYEEVVSPKEARRW
jgi:hypothetical protein